MQDPSGSPYAFHRQPTFLIEHYLLFALRNPRALLKSTACLGYYLLES
jgi:hypothetical protein